MREVTQEKIIVQEAFDAILKRVTRTQKRSGSTGDQGRAEKARIERSQAPGCSVSARACGTGHDNFTADSDHRQSSGPH